MARATGELEAYAATHPRFQWALTRTAVFAVIERRPDLGGRVSGTGPAATFEFLDALSRTRALTLRESQRLENAMAKLGLLGHKREDRS